MSVLTALRAPTSALLITRLAAEHGLTESDCLRHSGLSADHLRRPGALITGAQEIAIITNLLDALPDTPGLGFAAGLRYHATAHGIWGYALISSRSLRDAIDVGLRFLDLSYSFCRITTTESGRDLALVITPEVVDPRVARFVAERDIGIIATLHRDITGPEAEMRAVRLPYPRPPTARRIAETLSLTPNYGQQDYAAVFDTAMVDAPLPQADPYTAALTTDQCSDLLSRRRARTSLAGQVREVLFAGRRGALSETETATALHLSTRTLRRQLAAEGQSYRTLLDEGRSALARELLSGTDLPTAAIADRLGYSEAASFTRAFQRWTGSTPLRWRHAQRRGDMTPPDPAAIR
ncbi:AraC family transcriptional regulator [Nocardia sp. NPDC005978]|uniref:AraC family transcriptional regulator n=1 Tax=Nocardia sp. NPDC005978 TaxID=3156725 RepID=UPI0033B4CE83